ncbi:MAG TPA: PASTA domain-containing protein [Candidatus Dormibacteraeota bacterium]|nr:PASTA domain-containing protein [Candidatus Dormibacteraeota bacterium]
MGLREKFWRVGRFFLLLFVLGSAAFLSAITAMRLAIEGRTVQMPDIVGRAYPQAQMALRHNHLSVIVADHVYSGLPVDNVVRQSPPPGTEVKVGQQAQVVLSLGQQEVTVPNLTDRSLPDARLQLLNAGLQLGEVSYIYSAGQPDGLILQQDPLPGENGLASPRVSVLVSLGPRPPAYVMPDLKGTSVSQARQLLEVASLQPPQIQQVAGAPIAGEVVTGQSPPVGSRVDQTTPITIHLGVPAAAGPGGLTQKQEAYPPELYVRMRGRLR